MLLNCAIPFVNSFSYYHTIISCAHEQVSQGYPCSIIDFLYTLFLPCFSLTSVRCDGRALINDVLDLSKIEAGRMELESVAYDIRKEVDSVFLLFDDRAQQNKIELSMLVHDAVPNYIVGDPGRFRQVFALLLTSLLSISFQFYDKF